MTNQGTLVFFETARQRAGQRVDGKLAAQILAAVQDFGRLDAVLLQQTGMRGFDQSEAGTWQDRGHAAQDFLVDHRTLRVVRHFRGTGDVGSRGQQHILHDGSQQDVGGE